MSFLTGSAFRSAEKHLLKSLRTKARLPPHISHYTPQTWSSRISNPIRASSSSTKAHNDKKDGEIFAEQAKALNKKGKALQDDGTSTKGEKIDDAISDTKELQARTPWHREGSEQPPVDKLHGGSANSMTKGKLLTTPSRLLKLILPLTALEKQSNRSDIEPLALLVHPQQPLSYLERLIQSELPLITNKDGKDKVPEVWFRAEDAEQDGTGKSMNSDEIEDEDAKAEQSKEARERGPDEHMVDGKLVRTGKVNKDELKNVDIAKSLRGGPGEGGIETYSGMGRETSQAKPERKFVRWSSSTEIGDFIRDAARGREFAVEIEGASKEIRVGVPSFGDRTHYLRVRLRKTAKQLDGMAKIKKECDELAHLSAQRLALGGFGVLVAWWFGIYHFTFQTDYGWDAMEPITYLAGLSTIMLGYLYFLWHNREVSYRSALNITVSHRQNQLYTKAGFDVVKWESLVQEANALRQEIKKVAEEYDVEWDEKKDEASELVHQALREERQKKEKDTKDAEDGGPKAKTAE